MHRQEFCHCLAKTAFKDWVTYEQCKFLKPCWHCAHAVRVEYDRCGDAQAKNNFYEALERADREKDRKQLDFNAD